MTKSLNILKILILFSLISGCGFKVINQSELINFKISSISVTGDNKIGYIIKNKLLPYSNNNEKQFLDLDINVKKNKSIKEKNIKNEITKFEITIMAIIEYKTKDTVKFEISKNGSYTVTSQYSQTLNNEKKLIKILSEKLAEKIIEELIQRTDDT
tara:strand:- start:162 stop:629 length:468 start_codon:yes stop_codon:yes gene_type:complete